MHWAICGSGVASDKGERDAFHGGITDVLLLRGGLETEFGIGQNSVDVCFPESSSFRMALKSVKNWERKVTCKSDTIFIKVPIQVGVVNEDIRGKGRCRRMGEGILGVKAADQVVEGGAEGKEETENRLFNTGSTGLSHGMKARGSTRSLVWATS
jgi:hypothetical protein